MGSWGVLKSCLGFALFAMFAHPAVARSPFDGKPINYSTASLNDSVLLLQKKLEQGEVGFEFDDQHGYLRSVLKHLHVPISSQGLVFSKTSFQRPHISPKKPRAIYFGDDVYVGWVQQGEVIEISSVDPQLGAVFYTIEQEQSTKPRFKRRIESCMICHSSSLGQRVPGHVVQSIFPDHSGLPITGSRRFRSDHTSPLRERWGGWYVTGTHGDQRHLGNMLISSRDAIDNLDLEKGSNVIDLSSRLDTSPYLSNFSDIVALMVLEHQTTMHNFITAVNYEARRAIYEEKSIKDQLAEPSDQLNPITQLRINNAAEQLVKYLLFAEETQLTSPIDGTSSFRRDFSKQGPRDDRGRSLRDFDLRTRLFKYPCSYLIYSQSFDALPVAVKDQVYRRLWEILNGKDQGKTFETLSESDGQAILEILKETKSEMPEYWEPGRKPASLKKM